MVPLRQPLQAKAAGEVSIGLNLKASGLNQIIGGGD